MAKSNLSWSLAESKLTVEVLALKQKMTFGLDMLFPDFLKYDNVQQMTIAYGVKQKLADHVARSADVKLTPAEMVVELKALWNRITVDKLWNKPGEGKSTMKKRVDEAVAKASPAELAVLKKLGLA